MFFKIILILFALFIFLIIFLIRFPKITSKILLFFLTKNKPKKTANSFKNKNSDKKIIIEKKRNNNESFSDFEIIEDKKANRKNK